MFPHLLTHVECLVFSSHILLPTNGLYQDHSIGGVISPGKKRNNSHSTATDKTAAASPPKSILGDSKKIGLLNIYLIYSLPFKCPPNPHMLLKAIWRYLIKMKMYIPEDLIILLLDIHQ